MNRNRSASRNRLIAGQAGMLLERRQACLATLGHPQTPARGRFAFGPC